MQAEVEVALPGRQWSISAAARAGAGWRHELRQWLRPYLAVLPRRTHRHWMPRYLEGLLGPSARKSMEPIARLVAAGHYDQLHHFLTTTAWDATRLEEVLLREANRRLGGADAVLIVDDTTLLKQGHHSVGVAHQYSGAAGKVTNCQTLVSLTLARGEVPLPIALRLFLPAEWTANARRCRAAGVPVPERVHKEKWRLALEEIDRAQAAGVTFGLVDSDAAYGSCVEFRKGLSERGLAWAVGIRPQSLVYPATVRLSQRTPTGRRARHPHPRTPPIPITALGRTLPWRRVNWRAGTKGQLVAAFTAARVRVADGPPLGSRRYGPGEEVWLVGERRADGTEHWYLSNLAATARLRTLVQAIKARWVCEQAHQQLKEELGLDHFEGRSWTGLRHHGVLTLLAFAFLQQRRLRAHASELERLNEIPGGMHPSGEKKRRAASRAASRAAAANAPGRTARHPLRDARQAVRTPTHPALTPEARFTSQSVTT